MCGRYWIDPMSGEIDEYWKIIRNVAKKQEQYKEKTISTGDVYPTNYVLTLGANKENQISPGITKWGFQGYKKGQLFFNARSESVEDKPTFSKSFRESRCVIPANGFYEWDSSKQKYLFTGKSEVIYLAGLYRLHKTPDGMEAESTILTTSPNSSVKMIHDRMPLIVEKDKIAEWILDTEFARKLIDSKMPELISELIV